MRHYSLRQRQPLTLLAALLGAAALGSSVGLNFGTGPGTWPVVLLLWMLAALLPLLAGPFTIELDSERLRWRFGLLRWPGWELPLARIARIEPSRSTLCEGWGIRKTPEGMLYSGGGFDCVRIHTTDGRSLRLGSPDPARLTAFVNARLTR